MNHEDEVSGPKLQGSRDTDPTDSVVDLDVLRGWKENRDPILQYSHRLPALGALIQLGDDDAPTFRYSIHGTDLLLGRFQSHYAPVDLLFHRLQDHQAYRMGAPHAHLHYDEDRGHWKFQALSPRAKTVVGEKKLEHLHKPQPLLDGQHLILGVTPFEFRSESKAIDDWRRQRQKLLDSVAGPSLFLKRRGGICGAHRVLDEKAPLVLGRTFPGPGVLPNTERWPEPGAHIWDLSGVYDFERRYISFRHARIECNRQQWSITPLSTRKRTFVNRIAISEPTDLKPGDEIGLGSVLIHFHHPEQRSEPNERRHIPTVIDWSEGRRPSPPNSENE